MRVNSIDTFSFAGRIKKNQIAETTKKEIKKQNNDENEEDKYTPLFLYENAAGTAISTSGAMIPTVFVLMPLSDKSV